MKNNKKKFLPITKEECIKEYGGEPDFVLVTGDAYVDHPSFGTAVISRVLQNKGFNIAILSQPDYKKKDDFMRFGRPKYGFLVNSGNLDSMVNHYTVNKKKRSTDAFSPGGKTGKRPDRAVIVYSNRIREAYGQIPIVLGGLEASLRRLAHYDYWNDKVRRSILVDSKANYITYGMGERIIVEVCNALKNGKEEDIKNIKGVVYQTKDISDLKDYIEVESFEEVREDKKKYAKFAYTDHKEQNPYIGKTIVQKHIDRYVVANPPAIPLNTEELDEVYSLPYMRTYHPIYEKEGGVPAISEVKFSIISQRGCYGGCNFCSLAYHQGRIVTSRSEESILQEADKIINEPDFKGYIHDVGGPTANFRFPACEKQNKVGACKQRQCLFPTPCKNLRVDHSEYLGILRKLRSLKGVKKVFVRSGIRFDYLMEDNDTTFFKELVEHHVSGQLKVAPEHCSNNALSFMGKPKIEVYEKFQKKFYEITKKIGKEQYLVPYLISSHPGCTLNDAVDLALYLKKHKINPEQVQDFYPTPGTVSTAMYYTEIDIRTGEPIYVAKEYREKTMQRALLQTYKKENIPLIKEALKKTGRSELEKILLPNENLINYKKYDNRKKENRNGDNNRRKKSFNENKREFERGSKKLTGKRNKSGTGSNRGRK